MFFSRGGSVGLSSWISGKITRWLIAEREPTQTPLSDFKRICFEIRPCDVILIEGRSRVSDVIKTITQSAWTHAAIYIGRLHDIEDPQLRERVARIYHGDPHDQLVIEALMGQGTVVEPLKKYHQDHLRMCRPKGLSPEDMHNVIAYAIAKLGSGYDVRQLLDIARFMFPYTILPRRWRSTLFQHHAGNSTRTVCSSMIAAAFHSVHFPVLPVVQRADNGELRLYKRNTRIFTPCDFDYSPYFDIIKYPYLGFDNLAVYRSLPWNEDGVICNSEGDCFIPIPAAAREENDVQENAALPGPDAITGEQTDKKKRKNHGIPTVNLSPIARALKSGGYRY